MVENESKQASVLPAVRVSMPVVTDRPVGELAAAADKSASEPSEVRKYLRSRGSGGAADTGFHGLMFLAALSLIAIVVMIVGVLLYNSRLSWHQFGFAFFKGTNWDPVNGDFGALPFIYGTVVSSLLAVSIAVPLALAVSIFLLDICPHWLRGTIAFLTELLAAIPSVVYGLWAVFVLVPIIRDYVGPVLIKVLGWTGLFAQPNFGVSMFAAGVVLAIMIFPVVSSISRDVMRAVPTHQREAVLALGATRWEMLRIGVLRNARLGIVGAVILGLGRALGETLAVTMVIGNHPDIVKNLLNPAYTLASVIANEFTEATGDLYLSALIEIGLALFIVTIIVNAIARLLVWAVTRGNTARAT